MALSSRESTVRLERVRCVCSRMGKPQSSDAGATVLTLYRRFNLPHLICENAPVWRNAEAWCACA